MRSDIAPIVELARAAETVPPRAPDDKEEPGLSTCPQNG
jgi:hypothetical protein